MRTLITTTLAGSMLLFAGHALAAPDDHPVFTKNRTNPATPAFRIASDQIARTTGVKRSTWSRTSLITLTSRKRWSNRY